MGRAGSFSDANRCRAWIRCHNEARQRPLCGNESVRARGGSAFLRQEDLYKASVSQTFGGASAPGYYHECGGERGLVSLPVFKTGAPGDPRWAGSIPVRLRYRKGL
jgi:hypothetical protein